MRSMIVSPVIFFNWESFTSDKVKENIILVSIIHQISNHTSNSPGPRTSADGFSSNGGRVGGCDESPSMSVDNIPLPPPAMFSSASSSSDHQSNKFINFGCAECEGQAEHERIKSLLKQKKGKGSGGGKHPKLTENPENSTAGSSEQEVVWTKSSYSTLPNPRSRGHSLGGREKHPHHPHQDQPGSQVWCLNFQGGQDRSQDQDRGLDSKT